jgi:hypothetical protein
MSGNASVSEAAESMGIAPSASIAPTIVISGLNDSSESMIDSQMSLIPDLAFARMI